MMTWIAAQPEAYAGRVVGNGHCVAFVREAAGAPHTSEWRRGPQVRCVDSDKKLPKGIAIATFDTDRRYGNHTDGRSHTAILIVRLDDGLLVWDQWLGQAVHQRTIRYRGGQGDPVNDGDAYHVIVGTDTRIGTASATI
jgi:hypothetical protein